MKIATVGLDIAKPVVQVHAADFEGRVVLRRRLRRNQVVSFFANLPPCVIGMEACCGSHYSFRRISSFGRMVRLMAPQFVRPCVKSSKNDTNDAEAIKKHISGKVVVDLILDMKGNTKESKVLEVIRF